MTRAIDEERRQQFLAEGAHFETEYALVVSYMPPLRRTARLADVIYDDDPKAEKKSPGDRQIEVFQRSLAEIEDGLADILKLRRMKGFCVIDASGREHLRDELLNYLQFVVTGELTPVNVPPCAMYLDALLGGQELWSGDTPKLGEKFIAAVAIEGFPQESYPNILAGLESLPISFRFSSRFLFLDSYEVHGPSAQLSAQMEAVDAGLLRPSLQHSRRSCERGRSPDGG